MGRFLVASTRKRGQSTRQRRQRVCTDSFCVLPFLGRGAETRCSCCRVAGLLVCAGEVGRAAATPPPPGGPQTGSTFADPEGREPRRGTGFPGGHGRGLVLFILGGKRTTERSGVVRASGNEVFALRHKTGTRQCLVVAAFGWRGHRRVVRSATCGGPGLGVGGHQLTEEGTEERSKHPATRATALHGILWVFFLFS